MDGVQGTAQARARLDHLMDRRRRAKRMSWQELCRQAGMTYTNLKRIRRNQSSISWRAQEQLEKALDWKPGSIQRNIGDGDRYIA